MTSGMVLGLRVDCVCAFQTEGVPGFQSGVLTDIGITCLDADESETSAGIQARIEVS